MNGIRAFTWPVRLLLVGVVVYLAAVVVVLVQLRGFERATLAELVNLVAFGTYLLVGGLIVIRRGNTLGLLLVAYGSLWSLGKAGLVTAQTLDDAGHTGPAAWVTLLGMVAVSPGSWLLAATWLIFPDGRTRTTMDRRLLRGSGALVAFSALASVFATPQILPESKAYPHPFVDEQLAEVLYLVHTGLFGLLFLFAIFVAARLVVRTRHGDPIERRQVGWIAVGVIANITILLANVAIAPLGTEDNSFLLIDSVGIVLIPLAVGVAILRYRLYEIDRIVSRSVTFGGLAVFIGGVYIAIVVGVGRLLGGDAGFGLSVMASVLVALSFQPARRWVQRWANRLVYGNRATPHEVLVQFSHRSSELSDEELMERIPQLMVDGTRARSAALWTRTSDGFATVATWPVESGARTLADGPEFADPEADFSLPVFNDGELLGGLSIQKDEGEATTPAEEALLADLASGMGLALRNVRLTGALRRQVTELENSRERVLVAADAARRELENTLDSGPQQQLVALKVKLGPTRKRAEQLGAVKTAGLLSQLEQQAGDAIKAVREFAGGIYPPLLEAEGLVTAIAQQTRSAAMPVSVHGENVGRHPRDVEAAVYFSVLEAIQNSTKYAEAPSVAVSIVGTGQELRFDVVDDGRGFDVAAATRGAGLNGIADRLDTVGGTVTITSTPGTGTTITGTIPLLASIEPQPPSALAAAQHSSRASMPKSDFGRNPMAPAASAGSS